MVSPIAPSRLLLRLGGLVLTPALIATTACGTDSSDSGTTTVVTAVYPLAWLAERVGGKQIEVTNLAGAGADPHHVELTPRQIVEIERADLVLYIKGLQPSVDEAVAQHARGHSLDIAETVDMRPAEGPHQGEQGEGHHHEDGGGKGTGEAGHTGHEHGMYDPHVWLDPIRFSTIAAALGDRLSMADPTHADHYRKQAQKLRDKLENLDEDFASRLSDCESTTMIVSHQAFGYLAARYGLTQVGIRTGLDAETQPSPARVAEVARLAERENARVVFYDESTSRDLASVVANEVGAEVVGLDPVAREPENSSGHYFAAMRDNLAALRDGLGCA